MLPLGGEILVILSTPSSSAEIDQYAASLPAFDKSSSTLY
jgi:hypothetical protein